jgi:tetratricopeptide (TPR) repeat protein
MERRLQSALQKSPELLPLWSALAFLRHIQGRYDEAEVLCRQVLDKDPHNIAALNNLAWLLAFKSSQGPQQALELVQRAYQVIGPHPRLLDTRAVIYLALGQINLALKDLEDVLAESPEPSTYFHLAQARLLTNNRQAAGEALRQAKNRGLKETSRSLHPLERVTYQHLCRELGQP